MIPLASAISSGLTWSETPRTRNYELRLNDKVVSRLVRPSVWSASFVAETDDGRWTFRRGGMLGTAAEVLDSGSEQHIATFKAAWDGGGVLTFADGQVFHLQCKGLWRPVWSVFGDDWEPVLHLDVREKTVEVALGSAVPQRRLWLLIMFAWYRVLQAEEDVASAAIVA